MASKTELKEAVLEEAINFANKLSANNVPIGCELEMRLAIAAADNIIPCNWISKVVDISLGMQLAFNTQAVSMPVGIFGMSPLSLDYLTCDDVGYYTHKLHRPHLDTILFIAPIIRTMTKCVIRPVSLVRKLYNKLTRVKYHDFSSSNKPVHLLLVINEWNYDHREFELALSKVNTDHVFIHILGLTNHVDSNFLSKAVSKYPNMYFNMYNDLSNINPVNIHRHVCNTKFITWLTTNRGN
jgi:hypothetical protein